MSYNSDTEVTCDFDLTGAAVGLWDVYLKHNDDGKSSTLYGAFVVQNHPPDVTDINPDWGTQVRPFMTFLY